MNNYKSKFLYYVAAVISIFLIYSAFRFTYGADFTENEKFAAFALYAVGTWLFIGTINLIQGFKLRNYLEENHKSKWEEVTHVPFFGSGGYNSFRALPFVFSKECFGDQNLVLRKKEYRKTILLTILAFFTFPFIAIISLAT